MIRTPVAGEAADATTDSTTESGEPRWNLESSSACSASLWFIALRDIAAGEELQYDYGDVYWEPEEER